MLVFDVNDRYYFNQEESVLKLQFDIFFPMDFPKGKQSQMIFFQFDILMYCNALGYF